MTCLMYPSQQPIRPASFALYLKWSSSTLKVLLEGLGERRLGHGADDSVHLCSVLEDHHSGNAADAILCCHSWALVCVELELHRRQVLSVVYTTACFVRHEACLCCPTQKAVPSFHYLISGQARRSHTQDHAYLQFKQLAKWYTAQEMIILRYAGQHVGDTYCFDLVTVLHS